MSHAAQALALVVAGLLTAATASAAASDETRAEERFRDGEKLLEARDYARAAEALTESERLDPQLGTLINLALCHEALGRTATAMREFEIAATWAAGRRQADREQYARQHVADLAKHASVVRVVPPAGATGYEISIDGESIAPTQWTMPLFVDAGIHAVRVSAPGMSPAELPLVVAQGPSDQPLAVPTLAPAPVEVPRPAAPGPVRPESGDARRPLGLLAGGVGLVALSLASYLVARDGRPSAEAIAAGAAGGIVLGGGAWLYLSAGPVPAGQLPASGGQCATLGFARRW